MSFIASLIRHVWLALFTAHEAQPVEQLSDSKLDDLDRHVL